MPAGVQVGDLIVVYACCVNSRTFSVSSGTGWTIEAQSPSSTGSNSAAVYWKIADGSDALTIGLSSGSGIAARVIRVLAGTFDTGLPLDLTMDTPASSTNPNPPSHTPAGGADDYLWMAVRGGTLNPSAAPASYDEFRTVNTSGGAQCVAICERELNAASEDPGNFTLLSSTASILFTVAIHPA